MLLWFRVVFARNTSYTNGWLNSQVTHDDGGMTIVMERDTRKERMKTAALAVEADTLNIGKYQVK